MKPSLFFLLLVELAFAQTSKPDRPSLQLEVGIFGDYFYKGVSAPQLEELTGMKLPDWAPKTERSIKEGHTSSLNAGFYTATFTGPLNSSSRLRWVAGISFLQRTIAECFFPTDSLFLLVSNMPGRDSALVYEKKWWFSSAMIRGLQINFPMGLCFVSPDKTRRWIETGINISPGFTFNHEYIESTTVLSSTAIAHPEGPDKSIFTQPLNDPAGGRILRKGISGMYFTAYAGLPVHFFFVPANKWQFMVGLEPGYTITFLENVKRESSMMMRLGLGARYVL